MQTKIHIWEPPTLRQIYQDDGIPYTVMNFGLVPYGHTLYGTVFKGTPFDGCQTLEPLKWDKNYGTLIMLVERGGCNFSLKVYNAQKAGAGLVLIGNNSNEDIHNIFPVEREKEMLDKIHIPSILLSKVDVDNFLTVLDSIGGDNRGKNGALELAVHFELLKIHSQSQVKIILQVDDYRSYDLIEGFYRVYNDFSPFIKV